MDDYKAQQIIDKLLLLNTNLETSNTVLREIRDMLKAQKPED